MMKCIIIKVEDKKTGKIIKRYGIGEEYFNEYLKRRKENGDLGTNNLGKFLQALFIPTPGGGYYDIEVIDEDGYSQVITMFWSLDANMFNSTFPINLDRTIKVGDSAIPPEKTQYNLQGTILDEKSVSANWIEGEDYLDLSAGFQWTEDKTIYEIGLFYECKHTTAPPYKCKFMLDRTVIEEGIYVSAGQVLTITYRIMI